MDNHNESGTPGAKRLEFLRVDWFLVHTYSGYEKKVADNIRKVTFNQNMQEKIADVLVPMDTVKEVNAEGKSREVERMRFPSYVFVKMAVYYDPEDGEEKVDPRAWYVVRNTRGVTGFVGPDGKPKALTEKEVYSMGIEKKVVEVKFQVGDEVTIISGIMAGSTGTVDSIDVENEEAVVLTMFAGRPTPTAVGLDEIELIRET